MVMQGAFRCKPCRGLVLGACALALLVSDTAVGGRQKVAALRIGTSGSLTLEKAGQKEESALQTLKGFIKEETGLESEILRQKDWQELVDRMVKGDLHLGVFQG